MRDPGMLGKAQEGAADLHSAGNVPIALLGAFAVLFGLAFGSFLNVCISRLPRHESVARPRSRCPRCGMAIRSLDNIPLLSWVLLRGRCRNCRWRIPWRYPAVESTTAALFLLCLLQFGPTLTGFGMAILCFLLLGLAAMDAETMRLPDAFTLPGILLGIAYHAALPSRPGLGHLWAAGVALASAVGAALVVLAVRWGYYLLRGIEGMGIGDAKLLAMIAAWLGPALTFLTLFWGVLAAAIFGIASVASSRGRRKISSTRLPFGSFLCAAALYAIFAGQGTVGWYMQFYR